MVQQGSLVVISGFSGVGKGTVIRKLMELSDSYALGIGDHTAPASGRAERQRIFLYE